MSTSVPIDERLYLNLKKYCKKNNLRLIAVINDAVEKYLKSRLEK